MDTTSKNQVVLIDVGILLVVCIIILGAVFIMSAVSEHSEEYVFHVLAFVCAIFYILGSNEIEFGGDFGKFSDHSSVFLIVTFWLFWEISVCASQSWTVFPTPIIQFLLLYQPILKIAFSTISMQTAFFGLSNELFKMSTSICILILPFIKNDGLMDDEFLQCFQCGLFLFNYSMDYVVTRIHTNHQTTRLNSATQAMWCLIITSPLNIMAGTMINILLHLFILNRTSKHHSQ